MGTTLHFIADSILMLKNLTSLMAKNNCLESDGIPKKPWNEDFSS
jgi:hypothetical protein